MFAQVLCVCDITHYNLHDLTFFYKLYVLGMVYYMFLRRWGYLGLSVVVII